MMKYLVLINKYPIMGNYRFESFDTALEKANEWLEDYGPCDLEQPGKYFFAEEDTLEIIEERK